ncbi:Per1-domain-containing protein [Xylariaceae sp. FL0255]|nr:Per1-domain-containing protein [Xylariaceae sp. FL0255]
MVRLLQTRSRVSSLLLLSLPAFLLLQTVDASLGDRLPEFRECIQICGHENCDANNDPTHIPLHHRLLLWTCAQECDYACQHIITQQRRAAGQPTTQFHGKWPFTRILGIQEPISVLFSLGNLWAHHRGLRKLRERVPASYRLRHYYILFAYFGIASWVASAIFHTRDFIATEQLDYFAAGASILYGMYYTPVRVFRLDRPDRAGFVRVWTLFCCALYACHVAYLKLWRWNYTYNIAANVAVGMVHNLLWTYFSWKRWKETRQSWAIWPSMLVTWIMLVMSLELMDFPPLWGAVDAHSLWHLGTIGPTFLWYNFMTRDAQDDIARAGKKYEKT